MTPIHSPSKCCWVGLRTVKFWNEMRQTWVEISRYPCVISPNRVGHSDKVMKHSNVALSSICAWYIPLPYRWYSYLGTIVPTAPVRNSSNQVGKPVAMSVRGIVQLESEIWFSVIKNVNSWSWKVLLKEIDIFVVVRFPLDFHKVPYSHKHYVTVYFVLAYWVTYLHISPKLWKRRLQESVLVVILLVRS